MAWPPLSGSLPTLLLGLGVNPRPNVNLESGVIAHFFVPIPEPLGLPDGMTFEFHREATLGEVLEADQSGAVNPPGLKTLVSLRFWRTTSATEDPGEVMLLVDVAHRSLPGWKQHASEESDAVSILRERSVVEMVVPLAGDGSDEGSLTQAFDVGLSCLRDFQRAYYLASGQQQPLTLTTRERMPPIIPVGIRRLVEGESTWPEELDLFQLNWNVHADTRFPDLKKRQLRELNHTAERIDIGAVFMTHVDFAREARLAFNRDGDHRRAVLFAATSAELLLDELLSHLLWEEAMRPEDAAPLFDGRGLLSRVRADYHGRLGGNWSLTRDGPVGTWRRNVAAVRHRIIHAGYEPDRGTADRTMLAADQLREYVVERLTQPPVLARYPRTATVLLGENGLRGRGRWSRRLKALSRDQREPAWGDTFARWRATMNRHRQEGVEYTAEPSLTRAMVLFVLKPDRRGYWCVHDRLAAMAGPIAGPEASAIPEPQRTSVREAITALRRQPPEEAVSLALFEVPSWSKPSDWRPEYRVVPLTGVMVDRADLDPDLGTLLGGDDN